MQKKLPTFRTATRIDEAAVQAMIFEILQEHQLAPDPAETDADLADLENFYRSGWFAVLEWEGRIVGSVGILPEGEGVVELRKMYLCSTHRGRGWGRSVVAALANELLGSGVQPLYVTAENNQRSIRVAEAVGFTDTGTSIYSGSVTLQATN